ncbi:MAG TPA: hypothetical protein DEA96_09935 [Leptospiraceae bacterium]|nr:hypothetical protein [Spirochaetaceae bacterium]HBS05275.1 hypothetical protein [Leptospiraceae bacterium]|tara:strand:+ start:36752 stop:37207 length:456 start_codon:yes stop_codon:yes gene_type:complete
MKRINVFLLSSLLLAAFSMACTETERSGNDGIPEASIRATALENRVTVSISIPADHHAYLNRGPQDNLIPVEFDWKPAMEAGKIQQEPALESSPEGKTEEATGALVLRGTGEFVFSTAGAPHGADLRVRTQICNEISGMCFRPSWQTVTIQ